MNPMAVFLIDNGEVSVRKAAGQVGPVAKLTEKSRPSNSVNRRKLQGLSEFWDFFPQSKSVWALQSVQLA
jgi:hypothetical protein